MKLSDFCYINPAEQLNRNEEYEFIEMADLTPGDRYVFSKQKRIFNGSFSKFSNKDTLMAKITPCLENGKVSQYIGENKAFGSTEFNVFREKENVSNADYLYYLISSTLVKEPAIKSMSGASGRQRANLDKIKEIDVPEFNITTQEKIGKILSNYDDLIENNNKRIKILEEMAQKIYKEWFVDFKFPGYETTTFKDSELGKIPTAWEVIKANEIANIYIGRTPSRKDFDCFTTCNKDKKWVSIKDIGLSNEFIFDTSEYLTEDAIKKYNVPLIPKNTVILSFKLTVGKVTITTEEMTSNEAIAQFQIKDKEQIPTNYLYLYLKNFEYNNLGNTSSIGNAINSTIVKNMPIMVPQKEVIKEFNKNIASLFDHIKNLTLKNMNLKQTRDLLLPRLISGEINVEKMEIA